MADSKITDLAALTDLAANDLLEVVDISDTSMAASGTNKKVTYQRVVSTALTPTGITFQNFDRLVGQQVATIGPTSSGVLRMCGIWLPGGFTVTSISWLAGSTGLITAGTAPHFWVALFDSSRALLRQSNDDTAATWGASTLKTVNLSSTFVTTYTGLHYLGLLVNQGSTGTPPTLGGVSEVSGTLLGLAPILNGTSTTGLTTTAPNPAAAISVTTATAYCGVA